ncbi:MAG TPA: polysaccharide deacetylase family protein [Marinagarivorans sp.]
MKKQLLTALFGCLCTSVAVAVSANSDTGDWRGKKAAVSLTYDDALSVHIDNVKPTLDKYGFKGTFYVTVSSEPFKSRMDEWRRLAKEGHELGNHTMFHPCDGSLPGRDWVSEATDLSKWTAQRMVDNIRMTNVLLQAVDGKTERTFAYTCGDKSAAKGESFVAQVMQNFPGARGVQGGYDTLAGMDLSDIRSFMIMGDSADKLISRVDEAIKQGALAVFLFHGVGGEHGLDVSKEAHDALVAYLDKRKQEVWVAPMIDVVDYVKSQR